MPSFESLIIGAPIGFVGGCTAITKLESAEFNSLLENVLAKLRGGSDVGVKTDSVKALLHIIRSRTQASPKPSSAELAAALDGNTVLNREVIATIATSLEASDAIETMSQLVMTLSFLSRSTCILRS